MTRSIGLLRCEFPSGQVARTSLLVHSWWPFSPMPGSHPTCVVALVWLTMPPVVVIDSCWLCGETRVLSEEHFPPRSAFNDLPVLERYIRQGSVETGRIRSDFRQHKAGVTIYSMCRTCNSSSAPYDQQYSFFVRDVAERLSRVTQSSAGDTIQVEVRYPLRVLKSALKSFISANGPEFVRNRPWIRRFLLDPHNNEWDPDLHLYFYACATRAGRQSGESGMINIFTGSIRTLSEFTFWPLGSVLSSMALADVPLQQVNQWATLYRHRDKGPAGLTLPINVITTAYPLDFRSPEQVRQDAGVGFD